MFKKILFLSVVSLFFGFFLYLLYLYHQIDNEISFKIKEGLFEKAVASESPVYYSDEMTKIGVFFEKVHREYLTYDQIPKIFIKALIATEDQRFFEHHGFDIRAIIRALIANIKAGRIVQGGSTITQQLAKNIFGRQKRTYMAKLKELIQAIILEKRFSKEKILELYCNQFFVTGYGKGLQIASKYFFNKPAKDLTLVEAAFIAGAIHAPNRYNPFIKKTKEGKEKAKRLAKLRKDYVLKRMYQMHFITKEQYLEAKKKEVPFRKGKITYALNVIMDYVKDQLESEYMRKILKEHGIENIATSGIRIYTSIDKQIQEKALMSLRKRLPIIDVELNGYRPERKEDIKKIRGVFSGRFPLIGKVESVDREKILIKIRLNGKEGKIDYDGIKQIGSAWLIWKEGKNLEFTKERAKKFLENIHEGDEIAVWEENGRYILTKIPSLEGAAIVLHKGMIKAMIGGYSNVFYNRAVYAKRQLGSIFKPILFAAALKLKWNILDSLYNIEDIYRFEETYYFPRPDHPPVSDKVSMAWACVKSENLASVWLLYHLMDKLNFKEFKEVAGLLGLTRKRFETYSQYEKRIRDRYGIIINREKLMEAAFLIAKKEVEPDVIFSGHEEMLSVIPRLKYEIREDVLEGLNLKDKEKEKLLRFSYKRLCKLNEEMKEKYKRIKELLTKREVIPKEVLKGFWIYKERIIYSKSMSFTPISYEWIVYNQQRFKRSEIWIDNLLTSGIIDLISLYMEKEYRKLLKYRPYDIELLYRIPDFRTLVALKYVTELAKKIGIYTKLKPVLSFPLGPNSISILEAALSYQSIISGRLYTLGKNFSAVSIPIISKIKDREGKLIWKYEPKGKTVLRKEISASVSEILRGVIQYGTGRMAKDKVRINFKGKIRIPVICFGKTGTADNFTNSSFVGIVPGIDKKRRSLSLEEGYVIAVYVGYDDNRPMKNKNISIYGASGALPIWIDIANAIVNRKEYRELLQPADIVFLSPKDIIAPERKDFIYVSVSPLNGMPVSEETGLRFPKILVNASKEDRRIILKRYFDPGL